MTERVLDLPGTKRIVCLANSRKLGGRCIAGVELRGRPGAWVRPVCANDRRGLSGVERSLADGSEPGLLDIISVPVLSHVPDGFQVENWVLDPDRRWSRTGRIAWRHLPHFESPHMPLWSRAAEASGWTRSDRVAASVAAHLSDSLRLIRVSDLVLVGRNSDPHNARVEATFTYLGDAYAMKVTDPATIDRFRGYARVECSIPDAYLTVSLAKPFGGQCYSVVAAVMYSALFSEV